MKTIVGITNELNSTQLSKLDSFVSLYNKISHKLYVDLIIKKLPLNDLSKEYQSKYLISKRHFDSIRKLLEGKVSSIFALNKHYIIDTKDKIKSIEKDLTKQYKTYNFYKNKMKKERELSLIEHNLKKNLYEKIHYNRIRLDRLKSKLNKLENIRDTGDVRLCFGSNKLFRKQFNIGMTKNSFKNHEQWYKEWIYNRNKEFTLIGSKAESAGNVNCQITHIQDNLFNLKLNINHRAKNINDKYINLNFTLNHEVKTLINIIKNNNSKNEELWQPLTYKLIKQNSKSHNKNKYVISISFEKHLIKKTYTSKDKGCIGVDINQDHLAVSNLDNKGNLLTISTFEYDLNRSVHQNNNSISLAVKELTKLSVELNKPIVIEYLDFSAKKKSLKAGINKRKNKKLSSFAYSKIIELIKARAEDNFIEVREVNPAYTSIIGHIKYSLRNKVSVHHGAAMCIGRRGLLNVYNEDNKLIKEHKEKRISSKNRQIKNSILPVRNELKSVVYWKELKENMIKQKQYEKQSSLKTASKSTSLGQSNESVMNLSIGDLS